ncbi:MAG: ArsR/SmtB family transcription factor [Candidatus Ventricola sp.]
MIVEVEKMLKALAEPMRFRIYNHLLERKHCVRSLSKKLEVTESAISQHLKVMREAGLIYGEKYGYHTHFLPTQEAINSLTALFQQMRKKALTVDRDMTVCNCEFRKEEESK